jgi:hypothetical protein
MTVIRTSYKGIWSINLEKYVPFLTFSNEAKNKDYQAVDQRPNLNITHNGFTIKTKNRVDCEIKVKMFNGVPKVVYIAGFKKAADKTDILREEIESKGMSIVHSNRDYLFIEITKSIMIGFWELVECVENIDALIAKRRANRNRFYQSELGDNIYYCIIAFIKATLEHKPAGNFGRAFGMIDSLNNAVTIGYSVQGKLAEEAGEPTWQEHTCPVDFQIVKAYEMVSNNTPDVEIVNFFKRNNKVVIISKMEQEKLDIELKLQTTMPEGWKDGDSPLARLHHAGIVLEPNVIDFI